MVDYVITIGSIIRPDYKGQVSVDSADNIFAVDGRSTSSAAAGQLQTYTYIRFQ